jgi:hypothetical protein
LLITFTNQSIRTLAVLCYITPLAMICLMTTAQAQTSTMPIPIALATTTILPTGTQIQLVATDAVSSGSAKKGQTVTFRVYRDVTLGPTVIIPAGSLATGRITSVRSAGAFGRAGKLVVTCDTVTLPDGSTVSVKLDDAPQIAGRDATGGALAGGLVVGVVAGALVFASNYTWSFTIGGSNSNSNSSSSAGSEGAVVGLASGLLVAALVNGGNAKIPDGMHFTADLTQDIPIPTIASH